MTHRKFLEDFCRNCNQENDDKLELRIETTPQETCYSTEVEITINGNSLCKTIKYNYYNNLPFYLMLAEEETCKEIMFFIFTMCIMQTKKISL